MELEIKDSRLDIAVEAARKAGEAAKTVKETTDKDIKNDNTIVTDADLKAESIVRDVLTAETEHPILGEEGGGNVKDADKYWVVDPIDGTMNFSQKQPLYGTAVALVEENEPVVGVIYMPELDYLFYAVSEKGAYRNSEKLSVSLETDIECYYVTTGVGRTRLHPAILNLSNWIQQSGCAVMAEGWLASGWCDAGIFAKLEPWDMAAGVVLIREAGGIIKAVGTNETTWDAISEGRIVAGNERLVNLILNELDSETKKMIHNADKDLWQE